MMAVDRELARRLEGAEGRIGAAYARAYRQLNPASGADVLPMGGGAALFLGVDAPLTHAIGLGLEGPVDAGELDRMEEFYELHGARPAIETCPFADDSLAAILAERGYEPADRDHVMARWLAGAAWPGAGQVRRAEAGEELLWAETVGQGFLEKDILTAEELAVGRAIWRMPGVQCFLAFAGERARAAGAIEIQEGLAMLLADSTMPGFRGAGLQGDLIRARLRVAAAEGCALAAATVLPGSISERNYQRHGFEVAYARTLMRRKVESSGAGLAGR